MNDRDMVREVIERNRYLILSTTDGAEPWVAPLEFFSDGDKFYFFSLTDSTHAQHIARNPNVAVTLFDAEQPDYEPGASFNLRGVQIKATAQQLTEESYPKVVTEVIEALNPPMPPYVPFAISPLEYYVPKLLDGINTRVKVEM